MKQETAKKRILNAIKREPLIKTEKAKEKFFNLIYEDFLSFEASEDDYTSTQNLDFAIAIWLLDGESVIKGILEEIN